MMRGRSYLATTSRERKQHSKQQQTSNNNTQQPQNHSMMEKGSNKQKKQRSHIMHDGMMAENERKINGEEEGEVKHSSTANQITPELQT
mgnify:CR=1